MSRLKRCKWERVDRKGDVTSWRCTVPGCRGFVEVVGKGKPAPSFACGAFPWSKKEAA